MSRLSSRKRFKPPRSKLMRLRMKITRRPLLKRKSQSREARRPLRPTRRPSPTSPRRLLLSTRLKRPKEQPTELPELISPTNSGPPTCQRATLRDTLVPEPKTWTKRSKRTTKKSMMSMVMIKSQMMNLTIVRVRTNLPVMMKVDLTLMDQLISRTL